MSFLGIDIGCISLKLALVGEPDDGERFAALAAAHPRLFLQPGVQLPVAEGRPVLVTSYQRIKGSPTEATRGLLDEVLAVVPAAEVQAYGSPAPPAGSSARRCGHSTRTSSRPSPAG